MTMTNYEKIKAMSIEEMAEFFNYFVDAYYFPEGVRQWLESEVKQDG